MVTRCASLVLFFWKATYLLQISASWGYTVLLYCIVLYCFVPDVFRQRHIHIPHIHPVASLLGTEGYKIQFLSKLFKSRSVSWLWLFLRLEFVVLSNCAALYREVFLSFSLPSLISMGWTKTCLRNSFNNCKIMFRHSHRGRVKWVWICCLITHLVT